MKQRKSKQRKSRNDCTLDFCPHQICHEGKTCTKAKTQVKSYCSNLYTVKSGIKIFHAPISFKPDGSDNPNPNVGILAGCNSGKLFLKDSWNAQICEAMTPDPQDVIVTGKEFTKI